MNSAQLIAATAGATLMLCVVVAAIVIAAQRRRPKWTYHSGAFTISGNDITKVVEAGQRLDFIAGTAADRRYIQANRDLTPADAERAAAIIETSALRQKPRLTL